MKPLHKQSGVALITAILLVAIATTLATKLLWDNQLSMRRTETMLSQEQARHFATGGEAIAIEFMREDDVAFDHPSEGWGQPLGPIEIGIEELIMGQMQGALTDAQSRFNLNNLVPARGSPPDPRAREQFEELIGLLKLEPAIVDSVIDWIDEDTVPEPLGAEDGTYTALDPPYRAANNYLTSVTELRAIANIDEEAYELLRPYVTAIHPTWCGAQGGVLPINLNTAPAEVIQSLHPSISTGDAESWVEERGETGWENWNEVTNWPADLQSMQGTEVSLGTNCFEANVLVNIGSSVLSMYSLLDRSGGADQILVRSRTLGLE